MSIFSLLFILFLVLKLVGVLTWSWLLVCSPLIVWAALYLYFLILGIIMEVNK